MGFVADFVDDTIDSVGDAASDIGGAVRDAFEDGVDFVADAAKMANKYYRKYTGLEWTERHILGSDFSGNVFNGVVDNVANLNKGLVNGDWTQIRDSALGLFSTAIAVVAIMSGNPLLIAAGLIMLDAQYNQGQVLAKGISVAASIEEATIGTNHIETYAAEIQIVITVAASIYAANYSMPIIGEFTGVTAAVAQWSTTLNYLQAGYGGYQTYMAVQTILDSQKYWKEKLDEYMAQLNKWMQQQQAARAQWFEMMTDTDIINRIQAGGDMFIMGAGHDLWSMTSVAEPAYALGIVNNADPQMDNLINNRYYGQMAGNDGFRVN